jgi:hypothetical protein
VASIWRHLRGKSEDRDMSLDQWGSMTNQALNGGWLLPSGNTYGNTEEIPNDFCGYSQGAYKVSSAVFSVCKKRMDVFSEAKFMYQRLEMGRPTDLFGKTSLSILEKPWPNGTTGELLARAIQDVDLCGNHYVVREGTGPKARLRRLRPDWVQIILSESPDKAVASDVLGYLYKPGNTENKDLWKLYPVDGSDGAIAHWSPLPDPEASYRGMSWLTPVLRDIMQDKAATQHKLKFFQNAATPNIAVSFKENVTAEQFREFKKQLNEAHGGANNAYKTMYLGAGADVTVIGSRLDQLDFKSTQGLAETRIAAAGGVHPSIVGLSEGLQGSSLNDGNFRAARDLFADGTLRPLWRSICAAYNVLVEEFDDARLWYDTRDIEFLRQDQEQIARIQETQANTIASFVMTGYDPDSARDAVIKEDLRLLKHTGLYSVQLQPAGAIAKNAPDPNAVKKSGEGGTAGDKPSGTSGTAAKKPTAKKPAAPTPTKGVSK